MSSTWCSPWTLDFADDFASIEIAACDIEESLMHLISPRPYTKVLYLTPSSAANISIYYFDAGPATCSSNFWTEPKGQRNLALVGKEIARRGGVDFWTCNESAASTLKAILPKSSSNRQDVLDELDGTWAAPQQDGSNRFRACCSCAIVMSAKAQDYEAIFERLHPSATRAAISRGGEGQVIFQFVTRGAIREAAFRGDYTIYLYDRQQAEALRDKLLSYDYSNVSIEHLALTGFEDRVRDRRGRKSAYATPAERKEVKRQQNVERQRRHRQKTRREVSTEIRATKDLKLTSAPQCRYQETVGDVGAESSSPSTTVGLATSDNVAGATKL